MITLIVLLLFLNNIIPLAIRGRINAKGFKEDFKRREQRRIQK